MMDDFQSMSEASASQAAIVRPHRKLWRPPGFCFHTISCHSNSRQQSRSDPRAGSDSLLLPPFREGQSKNF